MIKQTVDMVMAVIRRMDRAKAQREDAGSSKRSQTRSPQVRPRVLGVLPAGGVRAPLGSIGTNTPRGEAR